jgi:predicted kinase
VNRKWEDIAGLVPEPGCQPDWQTICGVLPEIFALSMTMQNQKYHAEGNVFVHSQLCMASLLDDPTWRHLPDVERTVLFLTTLLHDIGKGFKTMTDDDGAIHAPNHARAGAIEARGLLWRSGAPVVMRERICNLIALHQILFHALDAGAPDLDWALRRISLKAPLVHLLILARADTRGRIPSYQDPLDCLDILELRAEELGCLYGPAAFPDANCRLRYLDARGGRSADVRTYDAAGSAVTLLSGLPASGKDTWLASRGDLPSISFDGVRSELNLKHGSNDGQVTQDVLEQARVFLRTKAPFAWNATFLSQEMRQRPVNLVARYHGEIHAVCLECPPAELYRRNHARAASVPEAAIDRMLRKWEPPCLDEVSSVQYRLIDGAIVDCVKLLSAKTKGNI